MSIKKQFVKTKPVCKVTFSLDAKDATIAAVVGDFNNWNPAEGELLKLKNGTFKATFDLPKDANYEFKYVVESDSGSFMKTPSTTYANYEFKYVVDGVFINEPESDSFKFNDFAGVENGVLAI